MPLIHVLYKQYLRVAHEMVRKKGAGSRTGLQLLPIIRSAFREPLPHWNDANASANANANATPDSDHADADAHVGNVGSGSSSSSSISKLSMNKSYLDVSSASGSSRFACSSISHPHSHSPSGRLNISSSHPAVISAIRYLALLQLAYHRGGLERRFVNVAAVALAEGDPLGSVISSEFRDQVDTKVDEREKKNAGRKDPRTDSPVFSTYNRTLGVAVRGASDNSSARRYFSSPAVHVVHAPLTAVPSKQHSSRKFHQQQQDRAFFPPPRFTGACAPYKLISSCHTVDPSDLLLLRPSPTKKELSDQLLYEKMMARQSVFTNRDAIRYTLIRAYPQQFLHPLVASSSPTIHASNSAPRNAYWKQEDLAAALPGVVNVKDGRIVPSIGSTCRGKRLVNSVEAGKPRESQSRLLVPKGSHAGTGYPIHRFPSSLDKPSLSASPSPSFPSPSPSPPMSISSGTSAAAPGVMQPVSSTQACIASQAHVSFPYHPQSPAYLSAVRSHVETLHHQLLNHTLLHLGIQLQVTRTRSSNFDYSQRIAS